MEIGASCAETVYQPFLLHSLAHTHKAELRVWVRNALILNEISKSKRRKTVFRGMQVLRLLLKFGR